MTRNFGISREDRRASAVGRALMKALISIESFDGDPDIILDSAKVYGISTAPKGALDALQALVEYYRGEYHV
jgi:hypothetical protein